MTSRDPDTSATFFSHAIDALEYRAVLAHIARHCRTEGGREIVRELRPLTEYERIAPRAAMIAEFGEHFDAEGRLSIASTDARVVLERVAEHNEIVSPEGLLAIVSAERDVVELKRHIESVASDYPKIARVVEQMTRHESLIKEIDHAIDRDHNVRDSATPKLRELRKNIRRTRDETRQVTDRFAKQFGSADYATFNGARYMLLAPREKCRRREGVVHAASQSGGSLYYEPLQLVEKNNQLETLVTDERSEETRILAELTKTVLDSQQSLLQNLSVWETLDAFSAMFDFAREFTCVNPAYSREGHVELIDARHPLLELSLRSHDPSHEIVPLNVVLSLEERVLVISGPNAGGKTVALKTVGLLVLLYQSGLPIPCAEGSTVTSFSGMFADIGDEQSIESSLSTFTSHLRHLDTMCEHADKNMLCLIDEIGDGTDPEEGTALAIATLEHLLAKRVAVIATTHYGKVKSFALQTEGVSNASMLFDDDSDRPLYRLMQGMAGRSRGIETAKRLDFCAPVIERAQSLVGEEGFRLEQLLSELQANRIALERERGALGIQSERLNSLVQSYEERERALREHEKDHYEKAQRDAEALLLQTRGEIEALVKEIRETQAAKNVVRKSHHKMEAMLRKTRRPEPEKHTRATALAEGDWVSLSPTGEPSGPVLRVDGERVTVEINGKKLQVQMANLYEVDVEAPSPARHHNVDFEPLAGTSVDVRGEMREEAIDAVDRFLDRAVLNGVQQITVIHGVGEGVLLSAIRDYLKSDSRVASTRAGTYRDGGPGVSIAMLK